MPVPGKGAKYRERPRSVNREIRDNRNRSERRATVAARASRRLVRARSSVGQSWRLITAWSLVRVQAGPPPGPVSLYARRSDVSLDFVTIRNFAIALFIGALVGVEREKWK